MWLYQNFLSSFAQLKQGIQIYNYRHKWYQWWHKAWNLYLFLFKKSHWPYYSLDKFTGVIAKCFIFAILTQHVGELKQTVTKMSEANNFNYRIYRLCNSILKRPTLYIYVCYYIYCYCFYMTQQQPVIERDFKFST